MGTREQSGRHVLDGVRGRRLDVMCLWGFGMRDLGGFHGLQRLADSGHELVFEAGVV